MHFFSDEVESPAQCAWGFFVNSSIYAVTANFYVAAFRGGSRAQSELPNLFDPLLYFDHAADRPVHLPLSH